MSADVTFLTLNTKSVRSESKWIQMDYFATRHFPDVLLLQETNCSQSPFPFLNSQYTFYFNPPVQVCTGTIIGLRKSSMYAFQGHNILIPGYLQELVITQPARETSLHVICIYIPHQFNEAINILTTLETHLASLRAADGDQFQFLIGGDFNTTLNPNIDRSSGLERYPRVAQHLKHIMEQNFLSDLWRDFHPADPGYTFISNAPYYSASRLDRFYGSPQIAASVNRVRVVPSFSDHLGVVTTITSNTPKRFPPYWRFDNTLLNDQSFIDTMQNMLSSFAQQQPLFDSLSIWWEALKLEIQATCIHFARSRKQASNLMFTCIERQVEKLVSETRGTNMADLAAANEHARDAYLRRSECTLAKARHDHLLTLDRPASSLLAREAAANFKPLTKLRLNGNIVSDAPSLCTIAKRHFQDVYSSTPIDTHVESILFNDLPSLSTLDRDRLDTPLNIEDFCTALHSLNKGKAPGIDGLTPEFYIAFWNQLKEHFFNVFSESFNVGKLPKSVQKAVITLLPKAGDRLDIKNWRPISLLTTDYKIITRALASRLSSIMAVLIHPDQAYCVPGRTIFDNLHLHRDILNYSNMSNSPLGLLSLDQQGAFDRVDHNYLFFLLKLYGFGDRFIACVKMMYFGAVCFIRVGSFLTSPIKVDRGIRQGCPMSGQLFSLTIEPFLSLCRLQLTGFPLPGIQERKLVVSAYADDVSVFVHTEDDFKTLKDAYTLYAAQSGAKLNSTKSTGLWSGSWIGRVDEPLGFKWSSEGGKYLGVMLGNVPAVTSQGFVKLQVNTTQILDRWRHRASAMSLRGRVLIINQFVAPRLWYTFQIIPPPAALLSRLQGQLANFVWAGRRHWTRLSELCTPVHLGGLGLIHLASKVNMFRVLFALRFISRLEDHPGHVMTRHFLQSFRGLGLDWQVFFLPRINSHGINQMSVFMQSVLKAWAALDIKPVNYATTVYGLRDIPLVQSSLIPTTTQLFIASWELLQCTNIGSLLDGCGWKDIHQIEGFNDLPQRQQLALKINYNRIQAYCQLRFKGVRNVVGPEPWPPSLKYYRTRETKQVLLEYKSDRRSMLIDIMAPVFNMHGSLKGFWSNHIIRWSDIFKSPTLGLDAEVTWRLNKNRLADPVFLWQARLLPSSLCPWCQVEGTAWHMIFTCTKAVPLWSTISSLTNIVLGRNGKMLLSEAYLGFCPSQSSFSNIMKFDLVNYIIVLAKSTVYRILVNYFKDNINPSPYDSVVKARFKARILKEYAWNLGRGDLDFFVSRWCVGGALCSIRNGELVFSDTIR